VAGPWFTVQKSGKSWHILDHIWISNGRENSQARVEIQLVLPETPGTPVVRSE